MTQNNDNAIQKDLGQRILVQEVKSFSHIQQLDDKLPIKAIYELTENGNERFFASRPVQASNWLAEKFNLDALQNCFYVCPYGVSIVKDWDIRHRDISNAVTVILDLEVTIDVEHSDSGKGLVNWLSANDWRMDQRSLENYLEGKITSGFLENTLGLYNKPWNELNNGNLMLNVDAIQEVVGSWLQVKECVVKKAATIPSQTWLDRNKTIKENARIQQEHQDKLDALHRKGEILQARLENKTLEEEYQKQKQTKTTDAEKTRLDKKYKMISDMYTYRTEERMNDSESTSSNDWPVRHMINEKYMVVAEPAEGSIGKVYKCRDVTGKVDVAVKRLPNGSSQTSNEMKGVWENFNLISPLDHQNIARYLVLDIDKQTHDNFLVMEYVEGEELRDWMNRLRDERNMDKRLQIALPVLKKIAVALDDVHGKNVIHRDMKPDNVKIKQNGTVKVLDFGLAVEIDRNTHMGHIPDNVIASAGSEGYKSPEQWRASCAQGPSVDQYSLAVMAYEMLSGRLPFRGDEWNQEVSEKKKKKKKMRPQKVEGLPSYANKALQKALSMEAVDRYPSCVEFVDALGAGITEANNGAWRAWSAVAAVLMLIALLGGVYAWKEQSPKKMFFWEKTNPSPTSLVEVEEEKEAREDATKELKKQLEDEKKALEAEKRKEVELAAKVAAREEATKALEKQLEDEKRKTAELAAKVAAGEEAKKALEAEKRKEEERAAVVAAGEEAKKALEKQLEDEKKKTKELEAKVAAGEDAKKAFEVEKGKEAELAAKVAAREEAKKALEKQLEDEKKKTKELEAKIAAEEEAKGAASKKKVQEGNLTLMLPGNVPLELVHIRAGSFMMGSPKDEPKRFDDEIQHRVTLTKDFWLGKYPVTQEQYRAVTGKNPSFFDKGGAYPVENVSWEGAMAFCKTLTKKERENGNLPAGYEYTLPTEAQWEYAARGGHKANGYHVYSRSDNIYDVAWFDYNSNRSTHPVGQKRANELGLYDMNGHVWEWCSDWYGDYPTSSITDPLEPLFSGSLRVLRGGSWYDSPWNCRSASRYHGDPTDCSGGIGFRVALAPLKIVSAEAPVAKLTVATPVVRPSVMHPPNVSYVVPSVGFISSLPNKAVSQSKVVLLPNDVQLELVLIKAGSFMMGSPKDELGRYDNEIQHRVTLTKDFWLGKYPVTQGQWKAVMGSNPSYFKKGDNYPVENVSWNEAKDFCRIVTEQERRAGRLTEKYEYTLPTEAQWEYACRAGTTTPFSFGSTLNGDKANCDGNYPYGMRKGTFLASITAVGSYAPNAWGLYDMHGNVWEWCRDSYSDYPNGSVTDPVGSSSGLGCVLRGGSWGSGTRYCRSAYRYYDFPANRSRYDLTGRRNRFGFRIALASVQ